MADRLKNLINDIRGIEISESINWDVDYDAELKIAEEQKVYFWIRLYLKEEDNNATIGDDISIEYIHSGEKIDTKFIYYGKTGLNKDEDGIVNFTGDDDKKVLCLMIDEKVVNFSEDIPFIRTMFKNSRHYEYQLVKRDEIIFRNKKNGEILNYYDVDW